MGLEETQLEIKKPVLVIGTGRSGLTPLMQLIAYHKDFSWPSQYNTRFPNHYGVSFISRIVELPFFNSRLKYMRFVPRHAEAFELWDNLFHGFRSPFRDLVADDVTPSVKNRFRHAVAQIMKYQRKPRFIAEYSGWSRIEFLRDIFPDAQFIHIVRDGRAVANSLTNIYYWMGWEGVYKWRWGALAEPLQRQWQKYDCSFLALAGIQWKILINNIMDKSSLLDKDSVLLIRYEDLVDNPETIAHQCLDFVGIDRNCRKFKKHSSTVKIVDANKQNFRIRAWRDNMSSKQMDMLNDLLADELARLDYL